MAFVKLTNHAKERAITRYGIGEAKLLELAQDAVMNGCSFGDAKNKMISRWIEGKKKRDNDKIYVKGGYMFIFIPKNEYLLLITCLNVPFKIKAQINA